MVGKESHSRAADDRKLGSQPVLWLTGYPPSPSTPSVNMASLQDEDAASHACFFYGTLMSVQILCRVIGRNSDHLQFADALLEVCASPVVGRIGSIGCTAQSLLAVFCRTIRDIMSKVSTILQSSPLLMAPTSSVGPSRKKKPVCGALSSGASVQPTFAS